MKQKRSKWVVCKKQKVLNPKTSEPVEVAIVTEAARANGAFAKYLQKKGCIAFDIGIHKASFEGRVELAKLPTVTIRGGADDNG